MYARIHSSNSSPVLELSVKFASQICHENINKPLDGAYLANFGINITPCYTFAKLQRKEFRQRPKYFDCN